MRIYAPEPPYEDPHLAGFTCTMLKIPYKPFLRSLHNCLINRFLRKLKLGPTDVEALINPQSNHWTNGLPHFFVSYVNNEKYVYYYSLANSFVHLITELF